MNAGKNITRPARADFSVRQFIKDLGLEVLAVACRGRLVDHPPRAAQFEIQDLVGIVDSQLHVGLYIDRLGADFGMGKTSDRKNNTHREIAGGEDSMPAIAVVIGPGTPKRDIRALGARKVGDVVEMSTDVIRSISEIDPVFARWSRRANGIIRIFYVESFLGTVDPASSYLLNIESTDVGLNLYVEPGSFDEARVMS